MGSAAAFQLRQNRKPALRMLPLRQPVEVIEKTLDRDYFMTPEEAKEFGLVDHVYASREAAEATAA